MFLLMLAILGSSGSLVLAGASEVRTLCPAVVNKLPQLTWTADIRCPAGQFMYAAKVTFYHPHEFFDSTVEIDCHAEPSADQPKVGCQGFVLGFQAELVKGIGIVAVELECSGNGELFTMHDEREKCDKRRRVQPRFRCNDGWAVCGIEIGDYFTDNFRLACCQLPDKYANITRPLVEVIKNETFEVIGPVLPETSNQAWGEPQFCVGGSLAFGVQAVSDNKTSNFSLRCGPKIEIDNRSCPWLMTGMQVRTTEGKGVTSIDVGCFSGEWVTAYHSSAEQHGSWGKKFRCSIGTAVCGYMLRKDFTVNVKLICCPIVNEKPCSPIVYYDPVDTDSYLVGLTSTSPDSQLDADDFQDVSNPLAQTVADLVTRQLRIHKLPANLTARSVKKGGKNVHQLVARCGSYEFRQERTTTVEEGDCDEMKRQGVEQCKCDHKDLKGLTPGCEGHWIIVAVATDKFLHGNPNGHNFTVQNRNDEADVGLGLFGRSNELRQVDLGTYEKWINLSNTKDLMVSIDQIACFNGVHSLKTFDFTKRTMKKRLGYAAGVTTVHLQLLVACGEIQVRVEGYRQLQINEDWKKVFPGCRIPASEGVGLDAFKKRCVT